MSIGILPDSLTKEKRPDDAPAPLRVLSLTNGIYAVEQSPGSQVGERVRLHGWFTDCSCRSLCERCDHVIAVDQFLRSGGPVAQIETVRLDDGTMPELLDDEGATARDDRFDGEYTDPAELFSRSALERVGWGR